MKSAKVNLNQVCFGKKTVNRRSEAKNLLRFTNEAQALKMPAPTEKPFSEFWHDRQPWWGVRVMRARARDGMVTRRWVCRHVNSEGEDRKDAYMDAVLGSWDDALFRAMKMRRESVARKTAGTPGIPLIMKAWDKYYDDNHKERKWAPATLKMWKQARARLWPKLQKLSADKVTPVLVDEIIVDIKTEVSERKYKKKNPVARSGETAARTTMALLNTVYRDLIAGEVDVKNPLAKKSKNGYFGRMKATTPAIKAEDLPAFYSWLQSLPRCSRDFILVGIFLAFRKSLIGGLRWDQVDVKNKIYRIPWDAEGNKSKSPIAFPISDFCWREIFKPRLEDPHRDPVWVITSPRRPGEPLKSVRGSFVGLLKKHKIRITTHSTRATGAGLMHAVAGELMVARFLTHQLDAPGEKATTAGYIQHSDPDLRAAMQAMSQHFLWLCADRTDRLGGRNSAMVKDEGK